MRFIASIFWNHEERRLRALWRLAAQLVIMLLCLLILQLVVLLGTMLVAFATGSITLEQLTPDSISGLLNNPPEDLSLLFSTAALVAFVGAIWLAGRLLDRRRFAGFGFHFNKDWWSDLGFGLFLGAFLMVIIFLIERTAGWVTVTGTFVTQNPNGVFAAAILLPVVQFVYVGIYEELFSRGYQLTNLAEGFNWKRIGPRWAIVIATLLSSAVFGLLHLSNPNASAISTFNIFLAGILLALGYILTGELAIPIGLHITWNFFQGNVFGFPVSGTSVRAATFIAIEQGGPELWTGGAFGPEGGLVGVLAMVLGGLLTMGWVRLRYGHTELHTPIAEAPERPARKADAPLEEFAEPQEMPQ